MKMRFFSRPPVGGLLQNDILQQPATGMLLLFYFYQIIKRFLSQRLINQKNISKTNYGIV